MPHYNLVFQSNETINGFEPRGREWIAYAGVLKVMDGGKQPVSLEMTFIPPHPYIMNMPLNHTIKAESITHLYTKVVIFLGQHGMLFRT